VDPEAAQTAAAPDRAPVRPNIPFLSTSSLTDLGLVILLLPIWWVLGLEQFVPSIILGLSCIKLMLLKGSTKRSPLLGLLLLLIMTQVASALFVIETERYITFLRTLSTYLTAFFVAYIVTNGAADRQAVYRLLRLTLILLVLTSVLGILVTVGVVRPQISSLAGSLLPESIQRTDYGGQIVNREMGNRTWLFGAWRYRISTFFLYSNMYAVVLAAYIPVAIAFAARASGMVRLLWGLCTLLLLSNLLLTSSRTSIAALLLSGVTWWVITSGWLRRAVAISALTGAMVLLSLALPAGEAIDTAINARGSGSASARSYIYSQTLLGVLERPVLGWGTERDSITNASFPYPIGSHSYYLGILYKHGIIGLVLLLSIYVFVWKRNSRSLRRKGSPQLALFAQWSLLAIAAIGVLTSLDLDLTVMLLVWVLFASCAALPQLPERSTLA
jgi:hypothetical protein